MWGFVCSNTVVSDILPVRFGASLANNVLPHKREKLEEKSTDNDFSLVYLYV